MEKIPHHEKRTVCRDYRYWDSKKMLLAWYIPAGAEGHTVLHTLLGSHGADLGLAHPRLRKNKTKHVALESGKHEQQMAFKDRMAPHTHNENHSHLKSLEYPTFLFLFIGQEFPLPFLHVFFQSGFYTFFPVAPPATRIILLKSCRAGSTRFFKMCQNCANILKRLFWQKSGGAG